MARTCQLRVEVVPPLRPGDAPPVVRVTSPLEVLAIQPAAGSGAWQVRAIAFDPGPVALPILAVDTVDAAGRHQLVESSAQTIAVNRRDWPPGSALAGMEPLVQPANPLWWLSVVVVSVALGAAGLACSIHAHRAVEWIGRRVEPLRVRRAARQLLRRVTHHGDARQAYHRIVAAVRLVLTYREGRPLMALTAPELARLADRLDLAIADRDRLTSLLGKSDAVRFGRRVPTPDEIAADVAATRAVVTSRRVVARSRAGC